MGFTTRSDIGPARMQPGSEGGPGGGPGGLPVASFGAAPSGYVAGRGRGMGDLAREEAGVKAKNLPAGRGVHVVG